MNGYIMLKRHGGSELLKTKPKAYLLLSQIALDARWSEESSSIYRLDINQSYVGDYKKIGLTTSEYKTAKKVLERGGYAHFKTVPGKGTIATLLDKTVFDINTNHEMTHVSPPKSSMKNDLPRPINNRSKAREQSQNRYRSTTKQPLTKKEEEKETTTTVDGSVYKFLEEESQLSDTERKKITRSYSEERIKLALEFARVEGVKTTLYHLIDWHCSQPTPPIPKNTNKLTQRAMQFNNLLKDKGYLDLADKNTQVIPLGHMFIPTPNGSTTITLNTTLEGFEKDLAECIELMFNG